LRGHPGIEILTPADPRLSVGITSFRLTGKTREADNIAIAKTLLDRYRIFAVHRSGAAAGSCVRITPALFNRETDLLALRKALTELA
jgi:isopenicillin-N epimerase